MREFLKYSVEKYVNRRNLYIFVVFMSCFMIFADYSTRSNREIEDAGKDDKNTNLEVESSYSTDKDGNEAELEADADNEGSTVEEEIIADEYEGSVNGEISRTE